jgi:hypothetical protein
MLLMKESNEINVFRSVDYRLDPAVCCITACACEPPQQTLDRCMFVGSGTLTTDFYILRHMLVLLDEYTAHLAGRWAAGGTIEGSCVTHPYMIEYIKNISINFSFCIQGGSYPPRQLDRPVLVQNARPLLLLIFHIMI